jgi:hypothetical protein
MSVESQDESIFTGAQSLITRKDVIETEMDDILETLQSEAFQKLGLDSPLVDEEAFPLSGVDLHEVRMLRNRFALLQTDLRSVVCDIERHLHGIHDSARKSGTVAVGDKSTRLAFGLVDTVRSGSAADTAGLQMGDEVLRFGPLSCFSDSGVSRCFDSIPDAVSRLGPNESIPVEVRRIVAGVTSNMIFNITPKEGRIGCLIKPMKRS